MKPRPFILAGILLGVSAFGQATAALPSQRNKPSRSESTEAIRTAAYELMKAFLTVDVATFKRRSTKRTMRLIDVVFEAAREDPRFQPELQRANITSSGQFLTYFLQGMSTQYLQAAPVSPEAAARKVARESTVSFISDVEAKIFVSDAEFARALLDRQWRIDLTDVLKKAVLKEFSRPEVRARIKSV